MLAKEIQKKRRHARVRAKITGTSKRPRLSVFKSNKYLYAQLIDDENSKTLATASSQPVADKKTMTEQAQFVGEDIAKKAQEKKIKEVVFDRSGYLYSGRIKILADAARSAGLKF